MTGTEERNNWILISASAFNLLHGLGKTQELIWVNESEKLNILLLFLWSFDLEDLLERLGDLINFSEAVSLLAY